MQLAALQGEYAQLTGTLFAARHQPCLAAPAVALSLPAASNWAATNRPANRPLALAGFRKDCSDSAETMKCENVDVGIEHPAIVLQPTNEAFRRAIDPALLGRLLTANRTEDVPLLSQLLQFHSVPSPLPLAVSAVGNRSTLGWLCPCLQLASMS